MRKAILFTFSAIVVFSCTKEKNLPEEQRVNSVSANNATPVSATVNQGDTTSNAMPLKKKVVKIKYPKPR